MTFAISKHYRFGQGNDAALIQSMINEVMAHDKAGDVIYGITGGAIDDLPPLVEVEQTIIADQCHLVLRGSGGYTNQKGYADTTPTSKNLGKNNGTVMRWVGAAGQDVFALTDTREVTFEHIRLEGNSTNKPRALIHRSREAGAGNGNDIGLTLSYVHLGTWPWSVGGVGAGDAEYGILVDGINVHNDRTRTWVVRFEGLDTAIHAPNSQSVLNHFANTEVINCGTGLMAGARTMLSNFYAQGCDRAFDLDGVTALIHGNASVEVTKEFARLRNGAGIDLEGGYSQASDINPAAGSANDSLSGYWIDASEVKANTLVRFRHHGFTNPSNLNPAPIHLAPTAGSDLVRPPIIELDDCTFLDAQVSVAELLGTGVVDAQDHRIVVVNDRANGVQARHHLNAARDNASATLDLTRHDISAQTVNRLDSAGVATDLATGVTPDPRVLRVDEQLGIDDTAKLDTAVAYANANGAADGVSAGNGWVIQFTARIYDIPDLDLVRRVTVDGVIFRGMGEDATVIDANTGILADFFGDTAGDQSGFVDTCIVEDMEIRGPDGNTNTTLAVMKMQQATRGRVRRVKLHEVPTLIEMEATTGQVTSDFRGDEISGSTADVNKGVVWSHGAGTTAGIWLNGVTLAPRGVPAVDVSTQATHLVTPGCDFIRLETQFDTLVLIDVTTNRYYSSLRCLADTAGRTIGNIKAEAGVFFDYNHTAVDLEGTGGNIVNIDLVDTWLNSTDGHTVRLVKGTGIMEQINIIRPKMLMAGVENVIIPNGAKEVEVFEPEVFGTGRLTSNADNSVPVSSAFKVEAGADRCRVKGYRDIDGTPQLGKHWIAAIGVEVITPYTSIEIADCLTRAVVGYAIPPSYVGSTGYRRYSNLQHWDGRRAEHLTTGSIAAPVSGVDYINYSGWDEQIVLGGGTMTQILVNGVYVTAGAPFSVTLTPGEKINLVYTVAPTFHVIRQ